MDKNGGQAFPLAYPAELAGFPTKGMTLRDWFAGQALRGIEIEEQADLEYAAEEAYRIADAMLAEREACR